MNDFLPIADVPASSSVPLVQIGATPVVATLRELLECAAEARRHGDHGAAAFLEDAALVALRREVRQ